MLETPVFTDKGSLTSSDNINGVHPVMSWHSNITKCIAIEYCKKVSLKINNIQFAYIFLFYIHIFVSWWSVRRTETCSVIDTSTKELLWLTAIHLVISKLHIAAIVEISTKQQHVRSQVFTLLTINSTVFWDVTPCWPTDRHQHSGGIKCLPIQGTSVLILQILLHCRWM
jgi:hypothetical protein